MTPEFAQIGYSYTTNKRYCAEADASRIGYAHGGGYVGNVRWGLPLVLPIVALSVTTNPSLVSHLVNFLVSVGLYDDFTVNYHTVGLFIVNTFTGTVTL